MLEATDGAQQEVAAQPVKARVAIAFYPGCASSFKSGYQPNTSLLMLLGALDDWTPIAPCVELGRIAGVQVQVYADSYHGFDNPGGAVKLLRDVPNGVNPRQGVHVGANPAAREQANARVLAVLAAAFDEAGFRCRPLMSMRTLPAAAGLARVTSASVTLSSSAR